MVLGEALGAAGCRFGCAFGDEVGPGNLPCPLWGGSFILWVQEGGKSL